MQSEAEEVGFRRSWWKAVGVLLAVALLAAALSWVAQNRPNAIKSGADDAYPTSFAGLKDYKTLTHVMQRHCLQCHSEQVHMKGVRLDAPHYIRAYAPYIYQQVVVNQRMPQNNRTGMTEAERQFVKQWFDAGAPTD